MNEQFCTVNFFIFVIAKICGLCQINIVVSINFCGLKITVYHIVQKISFMCDILMLIYSLQKPQKSVHDENLYDYSNQCRSLTCKL